METKNDFNDLLFQAIIERQQMFDSVLLPKLQEEFRIALSAAKTVETVLVKKGILVNDPYKYDNKTNDIDIPSDETYTETEKASVIGRRLSQYAAMLDYVTNYYQFNCDFLTTDRINKLIALNHVFYWEALSNTSNRMNTRGLAELVNGIRNGGDPLSLSIIVDALTQLSKSSAAVTKALKNLTDFHRERYKTAVRKLVMPSVNVSAETLEHGTAAAVKEVKRSFAENMKGQPFYAELIEEILKEEFSPEHAVLQQELLARLSITRKDDSKKAATTSLKPVLLDGFRTLGSVSPQLDEIAGKLVENHEMILSADDSFGKKLAKIIRKAFGIPEKQQALQITTLDPATQTSKRETIDFNAFIEDLKRRSRVYTGFTLRSSPGYQKIEAMDEKQIVELLTRHIAELNTLCKQCAGLDDHFKQEAPQLMRERIRGIKVEISAIRNNLVKANQCRAEYASQVEELQQLKKLGITNV
jgi:hypothetical protein